MFQDLIFDLGMHNGDDTAYYLHKGFRVVGVEANLTLVEALNSRFAHELKNGRLTILPIGIAETEGWLDFWVCDEKTEWSSFDPQKAPRGGKTSRRVKVLTRSFASILKEFGTPYYCKVDIEGNDHLCLAGMTPSTRPRFVSVEMAIRSSDSDLRRMRDLGYSRFKVIDQSTFAATETGDILLRAWLPPWLAGKYDSFRRNQHGADGTWRLPRGSSGRFGKDLPGRWTDFNAALSIWASLRDRHGRRERNEMKKWYDIHATE